MKKLIFLGIFVFCALFSIGQTQNSFWALPTNVAGSGYWDFNSGYELFPTTHPLGGTYTDPDIGYVPSLVGHYGAANAIHGNDGQLLFFVVGNNIYDKNGRTIYTGYYVDDVSSGFTEICVVPNPGNCNQYYLFTDKADSYGNQYPFDTRLTPYYSIVDISIIQDADPMNCDPGVMGSLVTGWTPLLSLTPHSPTGEPKTLEIAYAASPENMAGERLLLAKYIAIDDITGATVQMISKFRIDASGIYYIGRDIPSTTLGPSLGLTTLSGGRTELEVVELANGNYRVGLATASQLACYDLNQGTLDIIPGSIKIATYNSIGSSLTSFPVGLEFDPNGDFLYFTHAPGNIRNNNIDCFNANTGTWVNLPFDVSNEFKHSFIELDINGEMILSDGAFLGKISNVSTPGSSSFNPTSESVPYASNYWNYDFNDIKDKRYTLPDQIDGMDYTDHLNATCTCCLESKEWDWGLGYCVDLTSLGSSQTWTGFSNPLNGGTGNVAYIYGELRIPAGVHVTIENMTLKFHPDARLVVERSDNPSTNNGARLTLTNGSVLTVDDRCSLGGNQCAFMWQGVTVEGYATQSQLPIYNSKQGYLLMQQNSMIEHAIVGAQALGSNSNDRGGIIRSFNSTFRNNIIDVKIYKYNNFNPSTGGTIDNVCRFVNTTFMTDGLLNDITEFPKFHAFIYQSHGVKFHGCHFVNVDPSFYTEEKRGYGILDLSSKILVSPSCATFTSPCTSPVPNVFENLRYGIYAVSGNSMVGITVDNNEFINNLFGIYISSTHFSTITNNHFEVGRSAYTDFVLGETYGIMLRGSSKFIVEGNDFQDFNDPLIASGWTRGVIVENSGPSHNEIYRNHFQDLYIGGQSQGINSVNHEDCLPTNLCPGGLQWLCNDFDNSILVDLYVSSGSIDYQQGFFPPLTSPDINYAGARNLFSRPVDGYDIAIHPGAITSMSYVYYNNIETEPLDYVGSVGKLNIPISINYPVSCPIKYSGGKTISSIFGKMDELKEEIETEENKIDGGDQADLLTVIETGSNGAVKNTLMEFSPYLSDEILLAYIASNPPNGHLQQVMLANSPLSTQVLEAFLSSGAPNGIITQVNTAQTGTSPMFHLDQQIQYLSTQREYWVNEAIRYYLNDTIVVNPMDSVIQILKDEQINLGKEELCDAYIIKGDLTNATIIKNEIIDEKGVNNFTRIADVNITVAGSNDPMAEIDSNSALKNEVMDVATDITDSRICPKGEALLYEFTYSDGIFHHIDDLELSSSPSMKPIFFEEDSQDYSIIIYPNPATNHVFIEIAGMQDEQLGNTTIEIYNLMGQNIMSVPLTEGMVGIDVDVTMIPKGVYLVRVLNGEHEIGVKRLVKE